MIIEVKVITNAKKDEVIKLDEEDKYKLKVTAPPVDGKANKKVIEVLSKYFKTKKSSIKIKKGEKSHNKIIDIKK